MQQLAAFFLILSAHPALANLVKCHNDLMWVLGDLVTEKAIPEKAVWGRPKGSPEKGPWGTAIVGEAIAPSGGVVREPLVMVAGQHNTPINALQVVQDGGDYYYVATSWRHLSIKDVNTDRTHDFSYESDIVLNSSSRMPDIVEFNQRPNVAIVTQDGVTRLIEVGSGLPQLERRIRFQTKNKVTDKVRKKGKWVTKTKPEIINYQPEIHSRVKIFELGGKTIMMFVEKHYPFSADRIFFVDLVTGHMLSDMSINDYLGDLTDIVDIGGRRLLKIKSLSQHQELFYFIDPLTGERSGLESQPRDPSLGF